MSKEIILHIGSAKTGTTTIQKALYQSADTLLKHGIYYPTISSNHGRKLSTLFSSHPEKMPSNIRLGLTKKSELKKANKQCKKTLESYLTNPKIKKVIFSGELLFLLRNEEVARLHQWLLQFSDKITVICCTRNPVDWFTSWAQHRLKTNPITIDTCCKNMSSAKNIPNYDQIKSYIEHFGKENVLIYDFDKHKPYLYQKFLGCCRLDKTLINELCAQPIKTHNESLSYEASIILNKINLLKPRTAKSKMAKNEPSYLSKIKGQKFRLPKELFKNILLQHQPSISWLSENYPDECGNYLNWRETLERRQNQGNLFEKETIDSLAMLIANLTNKNEQLKNSPLLALKIITNKVLARLSTIKKTANLRRRLKPKKNVRDLKSTNTTSKRVL
jgi:hypothetical protein